MTTSMMAPPAAPTRRIHGHVAPGFEAVRAEFERNSAERGEIGAGVCAYWRGDKVVDLWGGLRIPRREVPWEENTMVLVNSTTKGIAAATLAVAAARGWLDRERVVMESLLACKRAGAYAVFSYFALDVAKRLKTQA